MTLRSRLTLLAAVAVTAVLTVASLVVYGTTAAGTRGQVDDALRRQTSALATEPGTGSLPAGAVGGSTDGQLVDAAGRVTPLRPESLNLPLTRRAAEVAAGRRPAFFADLRLGASHLRLYTAPLGPGRAVELAQPLDRVDDLLRRLRRSLVLVTLVGAAVALAAGRAVAASVLRPIRRLQSSAARVAVTRDVDQLVEVQGGDELAELGASFNEMLVALRTALAAQRQLVADASHELRTPLTSLRTNVEFLLRDPALADRSSVLADLRDELDDLSRLVSDLVDLSRLDASREAPSDVRLDELVAGVVSRAERRWPEVPIVARLKPTVVAGVAAQLERAVANLVDNAASWSSPGSPVEVEVGGGEVVVRDHGPGIPAADLPHVFERFYRSSRDGARTGSGLGLAIVAQAAVASGGSVTVEQPADGGTCMRLRVPLAEGRGE